VVLSSNERFFRKADYHFLFRFAAAVAGAGIIAVDRTEGVAVPFGILKIAACAHKVVNGEVILVVEKSRAAAYYLLELHHIVDRTHQHYIAHIAGVNACGKFLRCGKYAWLVAQPPKRRFRLTWLR